MNTADTREHASEAPQAPHTDTPSASSRRALAEVAAGEVQTFATVDALMADLQADD